MNVGTLIKELKKHDPNLHIVIDGYEDGTSLLMLEYIHFGYVDTEDGHDWCGDYGDMDNSPDGMKSPLLCLKLGRS